MTLMHWRQMCFDAATVRSVESQFGSETNESEEEDGCGGGGEVEQIFHWRSSLICGLS